MIFQKKKIFFFLLWMNSFWLVNYKAVGIFMIARSVFKLQASKHNLDKKNAQTRRKTAISRQPCVLREKASYKFCSSWQMPFFLSETFSSATHGCGVTGLWTETVFFEAKVLLSSDRWVLRKKLQRHFVALGKCHLFCTKHFFLRLTVTALETFEEVTLSFANNKKTQGPKKSIFV